MRLPSLVEPTGYADEGTYADIGRALDHGAVLYQQVWDNKPPLMYWLAAVTIPLLGASGPAFHAVLALLVGSAAAGVWYLGARAGGRAVATVATLTYIALVSLPNLDGDLLNAEVVGAALVVWAMVLVTGARRRGAMLGAGVLAALAVLTKAVFALDLVVLLAVALLLAPVAAAGQRGRSWVSAARVAGGAALTLAAVTLLLAAGGSLRGFVDVLVHQDIDYVQLTSGPGGHIVLSRALSTRLFFTALLLERILPPLLIGALAAWWLRRRGRPWPALVALWLGADVAGAVTSARGLTHYVQQLEPALALGTAMVAVVLWQRRGLARGLAVATVFAAWPLLELCSYIPRVQVAAANRDPTSVPFEHHNFRAAQLATYYALSYRRLVGTVSGAEYDAFFPGNLQRRRAVTALFAARSRPGQFVYVWGTVHWVYARSDRVPSGQYTSLNDAYYLDPGAEARLIAEVIARPPAVLVVDAPLPPRISDWLANAGYRRERGVAAGDDAWIAPATR